MRELSHHILARRRFKAMPSGLTGVAYKMRPLRAPFKLLLACEGLSICENLRYPGAEPRYWYLLPSVDVAALLLFFLLTCRLRPKAVGRPLLWLVTTLLVLIRLLRIADGIQWRFRSTHFNSYIDLPLLPEFVRLCYSTIPHWVFALASFVTVTGLAAFVWLVHACLHWARQLQSDPRVQGFCLTALAVLALVSPWLGSNTLRVGAFARSSISLLVSESDYLIHGPLYRARIQNEVAQLDGALKQHPLGLSKLGGANVYLFVIESYGQIVVDAPDFRQQILASYSSFESLLEARGYRFASALLDSPTYGGGSWLAHATLGTGVTTQDQFRYRIVSESHPLTIARVFHDAGYRTILAAPATTRPWPEGEFYGFDAKYYSWNLNYHGPKYSWAPMPDQYVVEFIRRTESVDSQQHRFVQYVLVSSHAPWNQQPPLIDDDTALDDGRLYAQRQTHTFPTDWLDMTQAGPAYLHSIRYDLEVIRRYVVKHVDDGALIIIVGDHQPNGDVTGQSIAHGVPIHVMSRNQQLVDRFHARGYVRGMRPDSSRPHLPMAGFFPNLVLDLS